MKMKMVLVLVLVSLAVVYTRCSGCTNRLTHFDRKKRERERERERGLED